MKSASKSSSVVFRPCCHPGNKNKERDTGFENLTKHVTVGNVFSVNKAQSLKDLGYTAEKYGSAQLYSVPIKMLSEFLESFKIGKEVQLHLPGRDQCGHL